MRTLGVLALLVGLLSVAAPSIRSLLPVQVDVDDGGLRVVGGCLIVLGAVALLLNREEWALGHT
jgi:uncharacterized protein YjeT (DUF2065 family)